MPGAAPVSDRSLHLWLSAVLGVWCGATQATVGLVDLGYWNIWRTATVAFAVLLSILIMASHPRAGTGLKIAGAAVAIACATATANIAWQFSNLLTPLSMTRGLGLLTFMTLLMAYPILIIRFLMAWMVVLLCAVLLRPLYRPFIPIGPTECRWCRYDQAGLPDHERCPECGKHWNPPSFHRTRARLLARRSVRWSRPLRTACRTTVALAAIALAVSQLPWVVLLARYHGLHIEKRDSQGVGVRAYGQIGGVVRTNLIVRDHHHRSVHLVIWTDSTVRPQLLDLKRPIESAIFTKLPTTDPMGNSLTNPLWYHKGLVPRGAIQLILNTQPRRHP